ncbi:reverse transcriptase domain-containing protein [Tanacetum coccineum]
MCVFTHIRHGLTKGNINKIFYHGLIQITQEALNAAAGGIFLYKIPNQAYQLLEDKVLLKLDWAKNQKPKSLIRKTVAFADEGSSNSDTDKIMARMDVMTIKMDARYKEMKSRTECNHCRDNSQHPIDFNSDDEDDKPTPQPQTLKPNKEAPTPKPYKPRIPYPQRLRKEKMEAHYRKFLDMIRVVRINVPLVDILARMPNFYEVSKYIHGDLVDTSSSSTTPLTSEELKVDKIVLSWLFATLSDSLHTRLVVAGPKSTKEAWDLISNIVKDNKRSRTNALKAELRSINLRDLSIEAYIQKIDSIITILASLGSSINDEDVVHYALEVLPDKYSQVCGYMHFQDTFPNLKTVHSLLLTEEMRLKTKSLALPADSSSPMGKCRFGDGCCFVHDPNVKNTPKNSVEINASNMDELLVRLLSRLGMSTKLDTPTVGTLNVTSAVSQHSPVVYYVSPTQGPPYTPLAQYYNPGTPLAPPGFGPLLASLPPNSGPVQPQSTNHVSA